MKVKVWVETEATADVSLGDMLAVLEELPDSERLPSMLSAVNTAEGILRRIPDSSIAEMNPEHRRIIRDALAEQVSRYSCDGAHRLETDGAVSGASS
ncbi:MAG: hypothetical protein EPN36_13920 [Rhodanobacteraceae bacterium]|nr:MAG: hypothetical protein EPN36_13920 [Rhodanobacteraceae bacterium]